MNGAGYNQDSDGCGCAGTAMIIVLIIVIASLCDRISELEHRTEPVETIEIPYK